MSSQAPPDRSLTRRRLLGIGAAGTAAVAGARALPVYAQPTTARGPSCGGVDVAVIGAGFSGLAAARMIARSGRSAAVLEARDRVGGRVLNHPIGAGRRIELGGQYVGPTQTRLMALARAYGVGTYPTYDAGAFVLMFGGTRSTKGFLGALGAEFERLVGRLQKMADTVPVHAPWRARHAAQWDSQTLQTWLDATGASADAQQVFGAIGSMWGAQPRDVSLLFALFYFAAAGNERTRGTLQRLLSTHNGAQARRFVGGSQLIAQRIAAALPEPVIFSAPVREIQQTRHGVRVVADGAVVDAKRVIVAIPPPLAGAIRYDPALPALHAQLLQRLPMGWLFKATAFYERPFWRRAGLSGQSFVDLAPVDMTFDNTLPDGGPGILFGFIAGHNARVWSGRPAGRRRAAVLHNFAAILDDERALRPRRYLEHNWAREQWSRGGPVAYAPPGVLLDYGRALRRPAGRVHWAGTETATYWNGYIEGAVRAGERAAAEVITLDG